MFTENWRKADDEEGESGDKVPEEVKEVGDEEGEGGEDVEDEGDSRGQRKLGRC